MTQPDQSDQGIAVVTAFKHRQILKSEFIQLSLNLMGAVTTWVAGNGIDFKAFRPRQFLTCFLYLAATQQAIQAGGLSCHFT